MSIHPRAYPPEVRSALRLVARLKYQVQGCDEQGRRLWAGYEPDGPDGGRLVVVVATEGGAPAGSPTDPGVIEDRAATPAEWTALVRRILP